MRSVLLLLLLPPGCGVLLLQLLGVCSVLLGVSVQHSRAW
jgi:hypothetical protein